MICAGSYRKCLQHEYNINKKKLEVKLGSWDHWLDYTKYFTAEYIYIQEKNMTFERCALSKSINKI